MLSKLIRQRGFDGVATATPATFATHDGEKEPTVTIVATVSVAKHSEQKNVHMRTGDESQVKAWLEHIDENDPVFIQPVLNSCRNDAEALTYFLWRANGGGLLMAFQVKS